MSGGSAASSQLKFQLSRSPFIPAQGKGRSWKDPG